MVVPDLFAFIKAVMIYHRILVSGVRLDRAIMEFLPDGESVAFVFAKGDVEVTLRVRKGTELSSADGGGKSITGSSGEVGQWIIERFNDDYRQ